MDSSGIGILAVLFVLLCLSGFFSATETAFLALNRVRIKSLAKAGDRRAALVQELTDRYDALLSTILVGNNIVNILASSLATMLFTTWLGSGGVTVATAVMTVLILIFGEISPKTLAKENPERLAMATAGIMHGLTALFTPVNALFRHWKSFLTRLFTAREDPAITEEELLTIVDEAEQGGGLDEHEGDLIRSAIEFNDLDAEDILTHRVDIVAVEVDDPLEEVGRVFRDSGFSRLPVYEDSIDNIVGVIHEKDFYKKPDAPNVRALMNMVPYVATGAKISTLLRLFQKTKCHIAVVTDEYGGTAGIVTMEDIIEELVGEIYDEHDEVIEEIKKLPSGSYQIVCSADLDELEKLFELDAQSDSATVSGWVTEKFGRIPCVGDEFTSDGLHVVVTKVDQKHVLEITVTPIPPEIQTE